MPTVVVGTAGHIDHGKTTLLRALTGIDADRLPEERARGMTIDVGYAHLEFEDGVELDFVDVPGHDRLVGNMLVGAGEVDAALLVVAADDGPRPQTIEHLALLDALGIDAGLAVVTKADVVAPERAAIVVDETRALLAQTRLAGAPVLAVSSATGDGLDALRSALRDLREAVTARPVGWPAPRRLAIDRVFSVAGRGAVVTGTLRGGRVADGDRVRLEPGGRSARVREVQVHGRRVGSHDGGRTALNLAGVAATELRRGDVLVLGGDGPPTLVTDRFLVAIAAPAPLGGRTPWPPRDGTQLRLHLGTAAVDVRLGRRGRESATLPGGRVTAMLRLAEPVATHAGERGVLRQAATGELGGGVRVLDPAPPRGVSRRRVSLERLGELATAMDRGDRSAARSAQLALHGVLPAERPAGEAASHLDLAPDVEAALHARAASLAKAAAADPLSRGLAVTDARSELLRTLRSKARLDRASTRAAGSAIDGLIASLVAAGRLERVGDRLRLPGGGPEFPAELSAAMDRLEAALAVASPPGLAAAAEAAGCPPDGVRALEAAGRITRLEDDLAWATPAYHRLAGMALSMARQGPLTPAAFRDASASSRRYVLAILEDLDRRGILARTAEGHVPGPRAPGQSPEATGA
ncbi:MAG TPA: selenocysteine-specific translation elongation factor [Candidatus Deferrimicrobiaceae bacterium]|nr:selenocysteine-specific translation elongation factor [Candidatus Deferrimicrobiaceae bacterium]